MIANLILAIAMALFEGVKEESVNNAVDVKPTFQLPKVDDMPMEYIIDGVPFEFDTPKNKFNKTAWKIPVLFNGIQGEIFMGKSLEFQIAVAMKKLDIPAKAKNMDKLNGMTIKIWMTHSESDNNDYYNCTITDNND